MNKCTFDTSEGYLGSGPSCMLPNDAIWFLSGCEFLLIFRKANGHYLYVEPCFVLGFMDGETREGKVFDRPCQDPLIQAPCEARSAGHMQGRVST